MLLRLLRYIAQSVENNRDAAHGVNIGAAPNPGLTLGGGPRGPLGLSCVSGEPCGGRAGAGRWWHEPRGVPGGTSAGPVTSDKKIILPQRSVCSSGTESEGAAASGPGGTAQATGPVWVGSQAGSASCRQTCQGRSRCEGRAGRGSLLTPAVLALAYQQDGVITPRPQVRAPFQCFHRHRRGNWRLLQDTKQVPFSH